MISGCLLDIMPALQLTTTLNNVSVITLPFLLSFVTVYQNENSPGIHNYQRQITHGQFCVGIRTKRESFYAKHRSNSEKPP